MNNQNSHYSVIIKTPYKFMWIFWGITTILCSSVNWWADMIPDLLFGISVIMIALITIYACYLYYKFYSKTSVKKIVVTDQGDAIITYQLFRSNGTHEYKSYKDNIQLKVENKRLWLLDKGKPIARIYKDTLLDKNDWDRLIDEYKR